MTDDWSSEETDDPLYADRRNFYKVEKCGTSEVLILRQTTRDSYRRSGRVLRHPTALATSTDPERRAMYKILFNSLGLFVDHRGRNWLY